jgi:hypothetical protein
MSFRPKVLKRSFGVLFLALAAVSTAAYAQAIKAPIAALTQARVGQDEAAPTALRVINFANEEAITTSFVQAPAVNSTTNSGGSDVGNWLKLEFHYSVNPTDPHKYPWVDSAEFKVWIEGRDLYAANAPGAEGVAICLTGSVTYINLAQSRDCYGVFYVHPSTLARYCGTGSYEDFDRKYNAHIEAYVGGKLVDYYDKRKDADKWWTQPAAVPNLVYQQDQSPFLLTDVTHYPMIKLPASGSSGQ